MASQDDAVLLIEDGVYAAIDNSANQFTWTSLPTGMSCYALVDDLAARGISDKMLAQISPVDWALFVSLTAEYDKVISWG
jgi:tRNA 2-thiouridine synthesizing protein B